MKYLFALVLLAALPSGAKLAHAGEAARAPSHLLAHNGYSIEYPRGCKLVFSTVRVNGVEVVLRQVKCPKDAPATS